MGEADHRSAINALTEHQASGSGCVIRCESNYVEGKAHSYRWHASKQANAETDVYTVTMTPWRIVNWGMDKLQALFRQGGLSGGIGADSQGRSEAFLKPFARSFIPFPHNAHHIVPVGVLWADVIDVVCKKAGDRGADMFGLVIGGFLKEPYNHHDQPNMVVLPTRVKESILLSLPVHLKEGARSHPNYSKAIAAQVKAEVPPKYDDLVKELTEKKHPENKTTAKVKAALVAISKTTYAVIMSIARARKASGAYLEDEAAGIGAQLAQNLPKALAAG
jgi:hypothetical protein